MMFDEILLLKIFLATGGLAIITGIIGCLTTWQRLAYFSDSLSHSAMLGVALGLLLGVGNNIIVVLVCLTFGALLTWLLHQGQITSDALLGIFSHSSLGLGVFILAFTGEEDNIYHYFFGDVSDITWIQVIFVGGSTLITLALLWKFWSPLVLMTLSVHLAQAAGISLLGMRLLLVGLLTLVVSTAIHIVGVLLLTSLLLIPPAAARCFAHSPESMAFFAVIIGLGCVISGAFLALVYAWPVGATIVVITTVVFIGLWTLKKALHVMRLS